MNAVLNQLLVEDPSMLSTAVIERILAFYDVLVAENEVQNLTRLSGPSDFYYGHVQDVLELLKSNLVRFPAMDLGSGGGVPGLLAAVMDEKKWILADSEKRKAEYLQKAAMTLGLDSQVEVFSGRAELYLGKSSVETIVARAVGPVDRIYPWIRKCSTWNMMVLLKGPGWEEEWARFKMGKFKNELAVLSEWNYQTGPAEARKERKIVQIKRVPRGTFR